MAIYILLSCLCFTSLYFLLLSLRRRKSRWHKYRVPNLVIRKRFETLLCRVLFISEQHSQWPRYKQLIEGCGLSLKPLYYLLLRRGMIIAATSIIFLTYMSWKASMLSQSLIIIIILICVSVLFLCVMDKSLLQLVRQKRREMIVKEIYVLSRQLLYYHGAKLNLHTKLRQCIPYTSIIRGSMEMLVREWYEDADKAIYHFKKRIGTEEGYSFAETINAIRQHENELYYDLLRQRIQDYKEKIELDQLNKKEMNAYVLFILAGVPIMNTFRVFIYPWVQEGQKLFQTLN